MTKRLRLAVLALLVAASGARAEFLLSAQDNQLDLYDLDAAVPALTRETVIPNADDGGRDINAQICRIEQADGSARFVAGEDTGQDESVPQGWGLFDPRPTATPAPGLGAAGWAQTGKIVPPFNLPGPDPHQPEMTGCALSANGDRLFLVDLGKQGLGQAEGEGEGSLFVVDRDGEGDFSGIEKSTVDQSPICVIDATLTTAGYMAIDDDDSLLVPESGRQPDAELRAGVVSRFVPDASTPCGYRKGDPFIRDIFVRMFLPLSIARRDTRGVADPGRKRWLLSQVAPLGTVNEYDENGEFVRLVVAPGKYNPAGIAVGEDGTLYFADLGLRPDPGSVFTPGDDLGALYAVHFDPVTDQPLPPLLLQPLLDFPEGLGIFPTIP